MVAAHHPPPHPHPRPAVRIVRHRTNRSPQLSNGVVILGNVTIKIPAFAAAQR
jgi:hypothetical protein